MCVEGKTERKIRGVDSNVPAEAGLQKREKWEPAHMCMRIRGNAGPPLLCEARLYHPWSSVTSSRVSGRESF